MTREENTPRAERAFALGLTTILCLSACGVDATQMAATDAGGVVSDAASSGNDGATAMEDAATDAALMADAAPDAPMSCLAGSPGLDSNQLTGRYYSTVNATFVVGQSFRVSANGTLVSIELALAACQDAAAAMPTAELFEMAEAGDVLLGTASVTGASAAPENCNMPPTLVADSVAGAVFDFSSACIALEAAKTYRIDVSAPEGGECPAGTCTGVLAGASCNDAQDCQPTYNVGDADGNPYADGAEYNNESEATGYDLTFKVTLD